jgi:hypothetical protein
MKHETQPAGNGLPACTILGAPDSSGADGVRWKLLCANEPPQPRVFIQSQDDPALWKPFPYDNYVTAIRAVGESRPTPFPPASWEETVPFVTVKTEHGFARAQVTDVLRLVAAVGGTGA